MIRNCTTCGYNNMKKVCNDCFFFDKWISKMDYANIVAKDIEEFKKGDKTMNEMAKKLMKNSVYGANAQFPVKYVPYKELFKRTTSYPIKPLSQTRVPDIKNVLFREPATIVFWTDGTKTVVKADGDDIYDPEKGLAMAISKKALGNQGNYYEVFKDWLPEEEAVVIHYYGKSLVDAFADAKEKLNKFAWAIKDCETCEYYGVSDSCAACRDRDGYYPKKGE